MTDCNTTPIVFSNLRRQSVQADFAGGSLTSDAGALLLREADWLDMLGVIGIARELAWGPNNLQKCYDRIVARRAGIQGRLTIPKAQELADLRIARMRNVLELLWEESFGIL